MIIALDKTKFEMMLKGEQMDMPANEIKLATVFFSPTGTTKKVVDYIAEGIGGEIVYSADLTKQDNREKQPDLDFEAVDLIIVGAPTYGGFLYKEFRNCIKCLDFKGKCVIAVTLYGNASTIFATGEMISVIKKGTETCSDTVNSLASIHTPIKKFRLRRADRTLMIYRQQ